MAELFHDIIFDYTIRNVTLGAMILGIVSGALGAHAFLRKQSLLGDSISHAALPGVALAFMLTLSKAPIVLLLGAAISGWLGTLLILAIIKNTRIDADGALGIVLSVFFGFGMVLLTYIQKMPTARQAGLDSFLFGQAATLMQEDVITMSVLGFIALSLMVLFWKEIKLMTFDPVFGRSLGFSERSVDILVTTLLVIAIVIGLQTVGVILMSAMIVAPASAARQWTDRIGVMVTLSAVFGAVSGVAGALISSVIPNMPTGPMIVLFVTAITLISILFSPKRGVLSKRIQRMKNRKNFAQDSILLGLYQLAKMERHEITHRHSYPTIRATRPRNENTQAGLKALISRGYVSAEHNEYGLTREGYEFAENLNGGYGRGN